MPIRAARSYQGHVDAGPKGVSWGSAIRTRTYSFKGYRATLVTPFPTGALPQGRTGPPRLQGAAGRRSEGRRVFDILCARQDLNLRFTRPQRALSAAGVRARGAAIRCRPGSPALRRPGHSRV